MKKLNLNMNLSSASLKAPSLGSILSIVFIIFIVMIAYSVYGNIYLSIFGQTDVITPSNIVRVDLKSYQETVDLIERQENFEPDLPAISNSSPF
jgi:hypothetical protein